jgi:hypothetical protein
MAMRAEDHFVVDGPERHKAAIRRQIEAEVQAEFANQIKDASVLNRFLLRFAMRREIRRRLDAVTSPKSLY